MTSPLSRISAGSFFSGYRFEYSSLGVPGATVVGTNSILSIRPSSIAAMRTLRAKGEAGKKVSFILTIPSNNAQTYGVIARPAKQSDNRYSKFGFLRPLRLTPELVHT